MTKEHKNVIAQLEKLASKKPQQHFNDSYTGSKHFFYAVSVPKRREIIKGWLKEHKDASAKEVPAFVTELISGKSHEEKTMGAYLLGYHAKARSEVKLAVVDGWLSKLVGWAEIDSLCQNVFQPEEVLARWKEWEPFLKKLAQSQNINKRRAALVFLTGPTWKSPDAKLHTLAYQLIDVLKHEKDILITKAISWLLRSMADTRKKDVAAYVKKNADTLPKIAVRETRKKLETGKKN